MYISPIQVGIQSAHVTSELFTKYTDELHPEHISQLYDWATNHKTLICLNGGYGANLHSLVERFDEKRCTFPNAKFHESQDALDGAITCVGIVLPERIYETAAAIRSDRTRNSEIPIYIQIERNWEYNGYYFTEWELDFMIELNKFRLA